MIVKPFRVEILQYSERVCKIHALAKYLPTPSTKGGEYDQADWTVCGKELYEHEICMVDRDGIATSMQYESNKKSQDYRSVPHE